MINKTPRRERIKRRHFRIRKKVIGTHQRPRLSLFKSNKHFYAQLIDDIKSHTILSCSTLVIKELKKTWNLEAAKKIGELIARRALEKGIKKVVLDRGGSKYHGKVLVFSEAAKQGGLEF